MGKIDSGCAGCKRLMHAFDPLCKSCANHCNYEYRGYDESIKREMNMLYGSWAFKKDANEQFPLDEATIQYCKQNIEWCKSMIGARLHKKENDMRLPKIEKVIFNDPATIVIWKDGTKTVVKCENEIFDPEKGLAMAISKKALGNEGNYYEVFKKWIPEEEPVFYTLDEFLGMLDAVNQILTDKLGLNTTTEEKNIDNTTEEPNEVLPFGCNKTECYCNCHECCPVESGNKRRAGKACKEKCERYADHFNN